MTCPCGRNCARSCDLRGWRSSPSPSTPTRRLRDRGSSPPGPSTPPLIDRAHLVDELFGIVNVPSSVWIDETGMIVRPPETAYPRRPYFLDRVIPPDATPRQAARMAETKKMRVDAEAYMAALRDWVDRGAESRFALPPDEVLRRSRPRPIEEAIAAAHFELGQHLYLTGRTDDAIRHFREAHRLQPDNWTYKRQAWTLADPDQGPTDLVRRRLALRRPEAWGRELLPAFRGVG